MSPQPCFAGLDCFDLGELPDSALVTLVARRGPEVEGALAVLQERHFRRATTFLQSRRMLSREDAEDAAARAFESVYRNAHLYEPKKAAFRTWFFKFALNAAIDAHRARRGTVTASLDASSRRGRRIRIPCLTEAELTISELVARLPAADRELIILKYFEGHTEAAIAASTGEPLGSVSARLAAVRRRLRKEYSAGSLTYARKPGR
jgi:RNA polymerase sigma-70 factor (ECF subfamily)